MVANNRWQTANAVAHGRSVADANRKLLGYDLQLNRENDLAGGAAITDRLERLCRFIEWIRGGDVHV